tara:strand:- start:58 stop:1203 length:1146 start_codon:yes stop_codon:yes gene_type:complete
MNIQSKSILLSLSMTVLACGEVSEKNYVSEQENALSAACRTSVTPDCGYKSEEMMASPLIYSSIYDMAFPAAHREMNIPVTIHVPPRLPPEVSLPVIVWTHGGAFVDRDKVSRQGQYWAAHLTQAGYVVVLVTHVEPSPAEFDSFCEQHEVEPGTPDCELIQPNASAYLKPSDTKAVIDNLDAIAARLSEHGIELLTEQLAVGGWSGGSASTLRVAGASYELADGRVFTIRDERPLAFIAASPSGDNRSGFTEDSFDGVERPVLTITAEGDAKPDAPVEPRVRPHYHMPATGDKYQMYINSDATAHGTLNLSPEDSVMHNKIQATTAAAFLDAKVRGSRRAQRYLDSHIIDELLLMDSSLRTEAPSALDLEGNPVPLWNIR